MTTSDDKQAFEDAMRDVKPLEMEERAGERSPRARAWARHARAARAEVLHESLSGSPDQRDALEQLGNGVAYRRSSLPRRTFRQLRRGRFTIEAETDLHGLTAAQARNVLREFLMESGRRGLGCVRVIHGKGLRSGPEGPVLKTFVHRWLSQWDEVLAFVTARARDGGSGAVYVLLRRR